MAEAFPDEMRTGRAIMGSYSDRGSLRRHTGRMFTAQVKAVCAACNSGWMSALEGRARPYLLPMIKGEIVELPSEAQQILATWTLKTALMCQVMLPQTQPNLPAELFTDLYRDRQPAEEMKVFCGYMMPPQSLNGPSPLENRSVPRTIRHRRAGGQVYEVWATVVTIRIGYAVVQLVSAGPKGLRYELGFEGSCVQPLWPVRETFSWPPRALKTLSEFNAFADPLGQVSPTPPE
ncbi:hypothetical protein [Streptomyces sp. WAC 06783]|uniref:hypothetical protein n=1 Tax=Streptomyces sp. WAC 06783 TaxID=2203211 RepID=UPI000F7455E6|nr:hypothetical protein [Streptomyces sp. WAC 06783]